MMKFSLLALLLGAFVKPALVAAAPPARPASSRAAVNATSAVRLRFAVTLPAEAGGTKTNGADATQNPSSVEAGVNGRLFVVLGRKPQPEPRATLGETGLEMPPVLARDEMDWKPGGARFVDASATASPLPHLAQLPPGDYYAQAVLMTNRDLYVPSAPGNRYSRPQKVHLDPKQAQTVALTLTERVPDETLPPDTEYVRYVRLPSKRLSAFWHRPMFLRAGVILPRDYDKETARRYPLWTRIGGYGSRFTSAGGMMRPGSEFYKTWTADDAPRLLLLHLDGAGPLGDPYQVNSANHGPYGDAITQELIPYVEATFRGVGQPYARVLDGGSTGGWVSLALQIFYPDFFNGTWSYSPDPVDFRAYQLVDIYRDKNAYVNAHGFERPSAREVNGDTRFTMRHECQVENVLGRGDSYTQSGGQWGAWNATFSPRGFEGRPVPLWNPQTGAIDSDVAAQWKKYDLRLYLEANWPTLAPKLRDKIHLWVGDADNYFLNNAVHLLDASLHRADPPFQGHIYYGPGKGHIWVDRTPRQIMDEMAAAVEKARP